MIMKRLVYNIVKSITLVIILYVGLYAMHIAGLTSSFAIEFDRVVLTIMLLFGIQLWLDKLK